MKIIIIQAIIKYTILLSLTLTFIVDFCICLLCIEVAKHCVNCEFCYKLRENHNYLFALINSLIKPKLLVRAYT